MFNWQNSSPSGVSGYPMHTGHPSPIVSFANAIYYPNYKVYNGQTPSTLNLGFVSHVLYAFAWLVTPYPLEFATNCVYKAKRQWHHICKLTMFC
jgi:hypothetical protein